MKPAVAAVLVFAVVFEVLAQSAAIRDPEVRAAVRDYEALSYDAVIPRLVKSLSRKDLSEADRREALAYLARSYAIFKRSAEAESTFDELLQCDPAFAPADSESPRIREAYIAAKARRAVATPLPPLVASPAPTVTTTAAPPEPAPNKTWLWIAGGVVVAAGIATLLIARPWEDDASSGRAVPDSQLGRFDLP
ncbi:MAG TPA: hypothetical protein VLC93_00510 [Myxococcota bacterium]|nr:hypothetical protein [Myxococcota bacterium]